MKNCLLIALVAVVFCTWLITTSSSTRTFAQIEKNRPPVSNSISGYYEGIAKNKANEEFPVTMELRLENDTLVGKLNTPLGNFPIVGGTYASGNVTIMFDAGGVTGTIKAIYRDGKMSGSFVLGDDGGAFTVKKTNPVSAPAKPAGYDTSGLSLSTAQWREDLKYLASELPKRHANAFHYTARERFEAAVAELDRQLDHLDTDGAWVSILRITSLIGDAHTYLQGPRNSADFPINIEQFGDEYRITSVVPGLEKALGARVLMVQDTPIARARDLIFPLATQDENPELAQSFIVNAMTTGSILHGLGITPDRNMARYTLANDKGQEFTIDIRAVTPEESTKITPIRPFDQPPLFRQNPQQKFWCTYLAASRTVYCNVRAIRNLSEPSKEMLKLVDQQKPIKLVIDLRQNGGGDFNEGLKYLIGPIGSLQDINRKGHLFVIVGARTFSAAMSNAAQFRSQTAATLVGQTIGEKPNSYQEPREFTLPNSHLTVRYSTRYYKFVESGENIIRPDKEIIPTWPDYKAGRDPVLDWILSTP